MELGDISIEHSANKRQAYENTVFTVENRGGQPGKDEGYYEHLRFENKPGERKCDQPEHALKQIKCMVYIMLTMIIVLYIAVIVVIIIITIPKSQADGNWSQWSSWSICDVTCGNGTQTRYRTCSNQPPISDLPCSGSATDITVCRIPSCPDKSTLGNDNHASFSARLIGNGSFVGPSQRIVFNEVLNNHMNGYDKRFGIFEAPLSGVYLFIYFIEIDGAYGKVELRLNDKIINYAIAYGMSASFSVSGIDNNVTFQSTKWDEIANDISRNIRCIDGGIKVSGVRNTVNVPPPLDTCPYKDGVVATGGNSAVTHVQKGEQVWIQIPENTTLNIRPEGTTFTGILLFRN